MGRAVQKGDLPPRMNSSGQFTLLRLTHDPKAAQTTRAAFFFTHR